MRENACGGKLFYVNRPNGPGLILLLSSFEHAFPCFLRGLVAAVSFLNCSQFHLQGVNTVLSFESEIILSVAQ